MTNSKNKFSFQEFLFTTMAFTGGAYSWLFQSTDLNPVSVLVILESKSLYLLTWCSAKYCIHLNRARRLSNHT